MTLEGMNFEPVTKYVPSLKPHCPFGGDITMAVRRDTPLEILKAVQQAYVKAYENPKYDAVLKQNVGYKVVLSPTESDKMAAFKECVTAWTFKDLGIAKNDPAELGIPGSAAMAIVLGSLNLHAIRVGPALEMHHPGLIYFFYTSLIVANLLMYAVALVIIKPGVKLFTMKKEILMPIILPLCAIGAYGINQSVFELYVMVGMGLLGWALYAMRYPLAPLILGVILGPMADENLRKAIMIFQGQEATLLTVLSRPIGTLMLVVIALTFYKGLQKRLGKTRGRGPCRFSNGPKWKRDSSRRNTPRRTDRTSRRRRSRWGSSPIPPGPRPSPTPTRTSRS
jgi:hypothetical protein